MYILLHCNINKLLSSEWIYFDTTEYQHTIKQCDRWDKGSSAISPGTECKTDFSVMDTSALYHVIKTAHAQKVGETWRSKDNEGERNGGVTAISG